MRAEEVEVRAGERPIRELNEEIRAMLAAGRDVVVRDTPVPPQPRGGLPAAARVRFEGSVGYYCGGLNDGARIEIERNAGWGVGEAMAKGEIVVGGYAGMAAGASMRGGVLHVRGDAGPRCGVAMKGGDVIVEGRIGYLSGFMAHAGRLIALGARKRRAGTRSGGAKSGWRGRRSPWVSIPGSKSRTPRRPPRWRPCSPRAVSATPAVIGARWCRNSGCGTSRAGTPRLG